MVDITFKSNSLRIATAQAIVQVSKPETILAVKNGTVPKGDVLAASKATGLLGVKKTAELLPDCHPMPIEYTGIDYEISDLDIIIRVTVKTIYKTGVEVEAMHGASLVALNIYDMLKPIDKGIEIKTIKLLAKRGGKSTFGKIDVSHYRAQVVVCSDRLSAGIGQDTSGQVIYERLTKEGFMVADPLVISDDRQGIQDTVLKASESSDIILLTGGTGLSPRDNSPEALLPILEKRLLGVEEKIRSYGQNRIPYAMLSRSLAGTVNSSIVISLPGSPKGVQEGMDAIFPHIFHAFKIMKGSGHDS